jgi:hypothetical protein
MPPQVLLLRGQATVTDVNGIVPEYALTQRRYAGQERADAELASLDHPDMQMARIAMRPDWVGVLDFTTRFPGSATAEQFAQRGR